MKVTFQVFCSLLKVKILDYIIIVSDFTETCRFGNWDNRICLPTLREVTLVNGNIEKLGKRWGNAECRTFNLTICAEIPSGRLALDKFSDLIRKNTSPTACTK